MRGNSIASQIPAGTMTVAKLAKFIGVSRVTVDRWVQDGWLSCGRIPIGKISVRIFNEDQQKRALRLARESKSRRPLRSRQDRLRTNVDGTRRYSSLLDI